MWPVNVTGVKQIWPGILKIWPVIHRWQAVFFLFLSDEGPMFETLDHTIRIGSTPTFLYFDLYLYSAYAGHYVILSPDMKLKFSPEKIYHISCQKVPDITNM